ncbi:MAG: hypothetical protein GWN99_00960 [Gemmatimonadetes bacterium]|uniref:Uncharacterized protein n=1 Tax=Candidatus Kutchimonas denitrificans TaxID=3056748 RepID=A0AAE4Z9R2_9BACT|nr:hypothetical protein [Gemmatimonadota bacterium]NIR75658.1 hypothetical protein [Candidatus Kutchimonas denitrificans]NIR99637.1 hypothetical protein [Gemmatimonadota bacterium]NIT65912.1 hypothetical protein [Gemmatimonadota bacterium]NIV22081.1 hypothetical protein [Gemmatimonadota bacterium]
MVSRMRYLAVALVLMNACEVRFGGDGAEEADNKNVSSAPEVPAQPTSGTIHGQPFAYEDASIDEGILKLRQGEDFFADLEVTLFLWLDDKTQVPEGRTWDIDCQDGWTSEVPHLHIAWREDGQSMPEHDNIMCDYSLFLEFGEETADKKLPGTLLLKAPTLDTELAGRFEATIEGFRIVDGQVDLSQDDMEVAQYLAEEWLSGQHGSAIEIEDRSLGWLELEEREGRQQAGYFVYWWRPVDGTETRFSKLQFSKNGGLWQVERELEPWQVPDAHPLSTPSSLSASFQYRAARRFEEEHRAARGVSPLFVIRIQVSYNPTTGLAEAVVRYTRDPERAREANKLMGGGDEEHASVRYLFRTNASHPANKDPESWTLDRRLEPNEEVDMRSGRVVAG